VIWGGGFKLLLFFRDEGRLSKNNIHVAKGRFQTRVNNPCAGAPRGVVPPWGPPALRCCAPLRWALAVPPPASPVSVVGFCSGVVCVVPPCGGRLLPPPAVAVGFGPVCRCPPTVLSAPTNL